MISFKTKKWYRSYGLRIRDFIWMEISRLNMPWYPLCELDRSLRARDMCPVIPKVMKTGSGEIDLTVFNSPHVELLTRYEREGDRILELENFRTSRYYQMHRGWREAGVNPEARTDEWILDRKAKGLVALYKSIRDKGYSYEAANGTFVAVLEEPLAWTKYGHQWEMDGFELFDGGHRAACLCALGYTKMKVLVLSWVKKRHSS